jgi:hypothetical protein
MRVPTTLSSVVILGSLALMVTACDWAPKLDVQTFQLEHRSGYEAAELIGPYVYDDRADNPGTMSATSDAITVRETRDNLEKIARVLEELDRPIPPIRLHFQLIEADSFEEVDPAISDVVQELESLFRFDGYRLVGEAMVPVAGDTDRGQSFSQRFMGVSPSVTVRARAGVLRSGVVRLDPVELMDPWDQLLETSVNLTPGQTVVIGGAQSLRETTRGRIEGTKILILTVRAETE